MSRVGIVMGGTCGTGEAISVALRDEGALVAAVCRGDSEHARRFTSRTGIRAVNWNVANLEETNAAVAALEAEIGPVDIIINNPGLGKQTRLSEMTPATWRSMLAENLGSCFNVTRAAFSGMQARRWGRIVNIASIIGQTGCAGQAHSAAANAAIHGFTKSLAQEGGPYGITVNAIASGYVEEDALSLMPAGAVRALVPLIPVGRLGSPSDITRAVLFLCSEDAGFVTGATMSINGGLHMH